MNRWFLLYLATVVLPLSLGVWAAGYLSSGEVERLRFEEDRRIAETGAALLRRDLAEAEARGSALDPSFLHTLEGAGGYEASLYIDGVRTASTSAGFGPDTLPARVHRRLALFPRGHAHAVDGTGAALYPLDTLDGAPPRIVILAAPSWDRAPTLPRGLLRITTGVGILLALAAWWAFHRRRAIPPRRLRDLPLPAFFWVFLPLVAAWLLVFVMASGFQEDARERTVRELARSLAIIRSEGNVLPPAEASQLTGFDVTLLGPDGIEETTLAKEGARAAIASIRPPPAAFTITGTVGEGDDEAVYVASRPRGGSTLVLSQSRPGTHPRDLGLRLVVLVAGMGLFSLLFPLMIVRELRRESGGGGHR
jgi:hypothetical protein